MWGHLRIDALCSRPTPEGAWNSTRVGCTEQRHSRYGIEERTGSGVRRCGFGYGRCPRPLAVSGKYRLGDIDNGCRNDLGGNRTSHRISIGQLLCAGLEGIENESYRDDPDGVVVRDYRDLLLREGKGMSVLTGSGYRRTVCGSTQVRDTQ